MKPNPSLRILCLLGFLLLMAPFYDSCNGHLMKQVEADAEATPDTTAVEIDSVKIDSTEISKIEVDTITTPFEISFPEKAYEFIDDENSESAFEFAKISLNSILEFDYAEFKKGIKKDGYKGLFFFLKNLCFSIIVLITFFNLVFSILKRTNWIYRLSILNLILLSITMLCIFLEGLFENISQIKWGYYAFIIVQIGVYVISNSLKRIPNSQIKNQI